MGGGNHAEGRPLEHIGGRVGTDIGGGVGQLFPGRAGGLPAGRLCGRRRAGEPGRLCGGLPAGRTGGRCRSAGPGRAGVGDSALAAAGPSAGLHGPGSAGPAPALRGAGVPAGLFHRLFRAPLRRYGLSAGPAGVRRGRGFFCPGALCAGGAEFHDRPDTGRAGLGGEQGRPPLWTGLLAALRRVRCGFECVCCWMASRFPRWCPAWPAPCWPDRELCEKVLDGWIINRAMPTT